MDLSGEDLVIQLDLALAEVLRPDAGPGLAIPGGQRPRLLAAAAWLGLDVLVAVHVGAEDGRPFLAAALHDVHRGTTEREARVWLEDGTLTPALAQALAAHLLTGEESPLVQGGPILEPPFRLGSAEPRDPLAASPSTQGSRAVGWTAIGSGVAAAVLAGIAVSQINGANKAFGDARSMLDETGQNVKAPYTVAQYNAAIRRGDRVPSLAIGTGVGAGAGLATVVMGWVSYWSTGEIGPLRF